MKSSACFLAFALISRYFICRSSGAVVNIDLAGFEGGILKVPENQEEGNIPVILTEAVNSVEATVVCNSLESGPSLTAVEFTNTSAPVGTTQVDVTFRIVSPGGPVTIQCSAQSQGNNTQFTLSGSKGNNGSLRVTKAPTLQICADVVLLYKYLLKSTFQVQFSERIKEFVVDVICSSVEPEPGSPAVLQLKFTETSVGPNLITAQVPYEIVALGAPVQVICRAQSTNLTALLVPPKPPVATVSTQLSKQTVTISVSSSAATAAIPVTSALATSSVVGGGARKRRRSILPSNRTVPQFQFSTSAGPPVTFALDLTPLRILPPAGFIRAPNGTFSAVLVLDQPADNTVDITCSLSTVQPGDDLYNTSDLCSSPPTVEFANGTEIKLSKKEIQFEQNELFKNINLTLNGSAARRTEELVRVTCCGRDTGLSLRYVNETAVTFIWVEARKLQPLNLSSITSGERKTTLVSDIDLTCPCNLEKNSCDAGCCCDQDCSEFENKSSTCIPGFFGGATSERPFEFSCQASWPDSKDWQPFLCVSINNSPVIGYFYNVTSPSLAQDSASFNTLSGKRKRSVFSYVESEERRTANAGGLYTVGTTVKTAANAEDGTYSRATLGVLSLPQTVFNGLCSQNTPVKFLEEVSSRCVLQLEESLCNSQSPWSALNYLMPIKLSGLPCSFPPAVLAQGGLNDTGGTPELANTEVQYFCTDITAYVSMTTRVSGDSVTSNTSSLFESVTQESADLTRCAFDDGETLPPAPVFNKTTRMCLNVVVKVEYEFEWRERRIDAVKAIVTLGNVQIPSVNTKTGLVSSTNAITTISQNFSVKFIHTLNSSSALDTFQRSGNPGYLRGRPVLSRLENSSGQVTAGKLQLWSPGPDRLCAKSTVTPVLYGEDAFSGCLLRLSFEDMRNCSFLREIVLTNQNRLIQATHVGSRGNADLGVPGDWLPVIREPISNNSEPSSEEGTCRGIPSGMVIEMLVTDAGKYAGVPQMEIVGTRIKFQFSTWNFKCVSGVSCSSPSNDTDTDVNEVVPSPSVTSTAAGSSASVNITNSTVPPLVSSSEPNPNFVHPSLLPDTTTGTATSTATGTTAGIATGTSTSSFIVSSSITPVNNNNNDSSSQKNRTEARKYPPFFQHFLVTSSVIFIKVPAVKPQRVKRSVDQTGICYRDVCKEELFFPLTEAYQGEPREKTLALSLFLIFLALVTFAVTKPWG